MQVFTNNDPLTDELLLTATEKLPSRTQSVYKVKRQEWQFIGCAMQYIQIRHNVNNCQQKRMMA